MWIRASTGPTPKPPAETRIVVRSGARPCFARMARASFGTANTGSIGIPDTVIVAGGTPRRSRWARVSSRATK